ncbi:MAG: PDZ domain-containing protein [Clostridia bacterium]|nr:PDZ domain-containing protein [Clostridia bacterium]
MFKRFVGLILILFITISMTGTVAFADSANQPAPEMTLSEKIEKTINNLTIFSRYDEVTKEKLYKAAFEEVFKDNPELYDSVMKALLSSIDEHSAYFNKEEAAEFLQELNDEVTGIGVNVFFSDNNIIVSEPVPGSPAEKAGIKAGDIIIGADGFDLRSMEFEAALSKIRGAEGTLVRIKIKRAGISEPLTFDIKREKVTLNPIDYEIIENDGKKIGKIKIYSFTQTVAAEFKKALDEINSKGIKNILIDVRDNGGGYLDQAIAIADMFLPKDAVITTEDHKMDLFDRRYVASGKGKKYNVVILVNDMSASASEVLTAALVENNAAKSVGEKTFGKGTVQTMSMIDDGNIIKYTTAFYLTPNGNNINGGGLYPTATVKNSEKPVDMTEFDMFKLSKTYRLGDKGEEVELAKRMLKYMGIFVGEVNQTFDENLKIAVGTYQKIDGLFSYGVLDITTQMNLYDTLKALKVESDDQLERAIELF